MSLRQRPLVCEDQIMHLPELALPARTLRALGRAHCARMNPLDREILEDVLHLAGLNVVAVKLRIRVADEAAAKRTVTEL